MLSLDGVSFTFRGNQVQALAGIDLELAGGEIHALVGENGAGKTTLARLCTGHLRPDSGEIRLDGERLRLDGPVAALERGLALVPQHPRLAGELAVWQNLLLGQGCGGRGPVRRRRAVAELERELADWGVSLPLEARAAGLDAAAVHWTAIAEALLSRPRVLFLDEPSAAYGPAEVDRLYALLRRCADAGMAVAVITHRLGEVARHADACHVLRKGRLVGRFPRRSQESQLIAAMFGDANLSTFTRPAPAPGAFPGGLSLRGLRHPAGGGGPELQLDLELEPGLVCGLIALKDQGIEGLEALLAGLDRPRRGDARLDGVPLHRLSPERRAYIPGRRFQRGIAEGASILDNARARARRELFPGGWLSRRRQADWLARGDREILARPQAPVETLSGGMIQRLIFERELAAPTPRLAVAAEPWWGLDRHHQLELYRRFFALARQGGVVLLLLSELDEAIECCDRLLVMRGGRIVARAEAPGFDRELLARAMVGPGEGGRP